MNDTTIQPINAIIEVRIRHYYEPKARHLCTWPSTDLDSLIPTVRAWGIEGEPVFSDNLTGQFVVDADAAFFELVIADAEEDR